MKPLESARWKLRRAHQHIKSLDRSIARFCERDSCSVRVEQKPSISERPYLVFWPETRRLPRVNWGLIFGDAVTNLRSSLDHVAWELSRFSDVPVPPEEEGSIYFPLFDRPVKPSGFTKRVRFFPARAQRGIERFQPYNRGNWPELVLLSKLSYLANRDKHRVVIPAYTRGRMRFGGTMAWVTVSLKENRPIQVSPDFIRRLGDDFNPQFRADIAFFEASDQILQRSSFGIEFLHNVHDFVRDAVFPPFNEILRECYQVEER